MGLEGLHILLAEDNPTNQMVAVQMLESLGARVSLASDGVEAIELAGRERFDLALVDIEMPRLPGTEVIRRLRAGAPPHSDMPLIALTAYVMGDLRAEIDKAGADGVIAKPILSVEGLETDILRLAQARRMGGASSTAKETPAPIEEPTPLELSGSHLTGIDPRIYGDLAEAIGPEALPDLLRKMAEDIISVRARLETGLARNDSASLRAATHVLIAVAGSIGATKLQYGAQCLNSAAHSHQTGDIDSLGPAIMAEIDAVLRFLNSKLQR